MWCLGDTANTLSEGEFCKIIIIIIDINSTTIIMTIITILMMIPVPIEADRIQLGRAGMRQMDSHIGGQPRMALDMKIYIMWKVKVKINMAGK